MGYTESGQVDSEFNVVWMEKNKDESGYEESVLFLLLLYSFNTGFLLDGYIHLSHYNGLHYWHYESLSFNCT